MTRLAVRNYFRRARKHPPTPQECSAAWLDLDFADAIFLSGVPVERTDELCRLYDGALHLLLDSGMKMSQIVGRN